MFTIINEDLMSFKIVKAMDEKLNKEFFKMRVSTSNKLVQKESYVNKGYQSDKFNKNPIENHNEKMIPLNKEIIYISAPLKTLTGMEKINKNVTVPIKWNGAPNSIHVNTGRNSLDTQIDIRYHESGSDNANIFVIAFPFNGLIKPLDEDPKYRIYKGFIATSAKPIIFKSKKYRKILYLVIEINKNLFDAGHKYHCKSIPITLESYALFEDKLDGKKKTNYEKMELNITSSNGDYELNWEYKLINEAIYMNMEQGTLLWPTYKFENFEESPNFVARPLKNNKKPKLQNNQRKRINNHFVTSDDQLPPPTGYRVTVNKNGIRKEVPVRAQRKHESLEEMMRNSGMYDNYERKPAGRKGGKNRSKWK